jgi:DNA polymerase III alpha subunit
MAFDTETLGQALIDQKVITNEQLNQALEEAERTGNPLEIVLTDMGFVKIEDFQHTYEVVVFGSVFPQFEQYLQADNIVFIQGRLNSDLDDNVLKFIGERILPIDTVPETMTP